MGRLPLALLLLASSLITQVYGAALTFALSPNERQCFFADVDKVREKIGFYFAVQSGGNFEVAFSVAAPSSRSLLEMSGERQGDYVFTANEVGEYSFCFQSDMATLSPKLIDFDIMVESEPRREASAKPGQISEQTSALEESINRLNGQLANIKRTQRYFHTRENRGFALVKSTQSKIFWYALFESLAVIAMAVVQVYVLQMFFTKTGKKYKRLDLPEATKVYI